MGENIKSKQTIKISAPEREEKIGLLGGTYLVSKSNTYCQYITLLDLDERFMTLGIE